MSWGPIQKEKQNRVGFAQGVTPGQSGGGDPQSSEPAPPPPPW